MAMEENIQIVRNRVASGASISSIDRLGVEGSNSLDSVRTGSPVHWDMILQSLSTTLPAIFHTPPPPEDKPQDGSHLGAEQQPCSTRHLSVLGARGTVVRGSLNRQDRRRPLSNLCRTENDHSTTSSTTIRSIRVRHEETEEKLNENLSMICRPKSPRIQNGEEIENQHKTGLRLKESLKSGVRIKIDVSQHDLDKIVIAVSSDNALHVYLVGTENKTLHVLQLSENPPLQSLVCSVVDGTSLYIRERSKEGMVLKYAGSQERFLPLVKLDETSLKFTIVLHIPNYVTCEDISVKTVDESLVIKGEHGTGENRVSFRIMMALPDGADNRSVTARMADFNQAVIEGSLGLASRRMTCNF